MTQQDRLTKYLSGGDSRKQVSFSCQNLFAAEAREDLVVPITMELIEQSKGHCNDPMRCLITTAVQRVKPNVTAIGTLKSVTYLFTAHGPIRYLLGPEAYFLRQGYDKKEIPRQVLKIIKKDGVYKVTLKKVPKYKWRVNMLAAYHIRRESGKDPKSHASKAKVPGKSQHPRPVMNTRLRRLNGYLRSVL